MLKLLRKCLVAAVIGSAALLPVFPAAAAPGDQVQDGYVGTRDDALSYVPEGQFSGYPDWARQVFTRGG